VISPDCGANSRLLYAWALGEPRDVFDQQLSQVYFIPLNTPNSPWNDTLVHVRALQALMGEA